MDTPTIRRKFIDFFTAKEHAHLPAAKLVNEKDPDLLFINAGMNPFKNTFLGNTTAPHPRVVTSQPCLRVTGKHNDLREVGIDTYHHTLFEMLGNWSFGNYFKEEAIQWAWELITQVYNISPKILYATIFGGDDKDGLAADKEAFNLWQQYLPTDQILYGNKKDNFWEMGTTGPCGPCSEIHIDLRSKKDQATVTGRELVNKNHPEVIEIWNLVFMQYNRQLSGKLTSLPMQHVDTGMGLERLAMAIQNQPSTYHTDTFTPIIEAIAEASYTSYGKEKTIDIALRVIADHLRAITFAIADGAIPSNQKAGYVTRMLLRRAMRYGHTYLHLAEPFLYQLLPLVVKLSTSAYPHLQEELPSITSIVYQEEVTFNKTLARGLKRLQHLLTQLPKHAQHLGGEEVFELYDTYGFPPDLTDLLVNEQGLTIDKQGFEKSMQAQQQRSQHANSQQSSDWIEILPTNTSSFVGYDTLQTTSRLTKYRTIRKRGQNYYQLVLDNTPFYPEGGGQVGDTGLLCAGEQKIKVYDTKKENGLIVHYTEELPQKLTSRLIAKVDAKRRVAISNNHTATHLMLAAMRQVLGTHVTQKGSLVNEHLLRFDFTHDKPLTQQELEAIEKLVNTKIQANIAQQRLAEVAVEKAKEMGAIGTFEERYSNRVRVIIFENNYSIELCGGTHASHTGQIGLFKILAERGIGSGIRRVEAITALEALQFVQDQTKMLTQLTSLLKGVKEPVQALTNFIEEHKALQKQCDKLRSEQLAIQLKNVEAKLYKKDNLHIAIEKVQLWHPETLRSLIFSLQKKYSNLLLILTTVIANKPHVAIGVSKNLTHRYDANKLLQQLTPYIDGKGGGQAFFAIAAGSDPQGINALLQAAHQMFDNDNDFD